MKQIILALIVIVVVASLAGVGTYASFSDIEVSTDNYLVTGSLDLQLGDDAPVVIRKDGTIEYPSAIAEGIGEDPLGDSVTETWLLPSADVGDTVDSCVYVQNVGSESGEQLNIYWHINNIDFDGETSNKDEMLVINNLEYCNSSRIPIVWTIDDTQHSDPNYIVDQDGDLRITLHDLELHGISGLPVPDNIFTRLEMRITFDVLPGVDENQYQGDQTNMSMTFHLE